MQSPGGASPLAVGWLFNKVDVGHAFWKAEITNTKVTPNDVLPNDADKIQYVNKAWGYYPVGLINPGNDFSASGELRQGGGNGYEVKGLIGRNPFVSVLNYTKETVRNPGTYVLAERIEVFSKNGDTRIYCTSKAERNCATVAVDAARTAGLFLAGNGGHDGTYLYAGDEQISSYRFVGHSPWKLAKDLGLNN